MPNRGSEKAREGVEMAQPGSVVEGVRSEGVLGRASAQRFRAELAGGGPYRGRPAVDATNAKARRDSAAFEASHRAGCAMELGMAAAAARWGSSAGGVMAVSMGHAAARAPYELGFATSSADSWRMSMKT